MKTIGLIGGMSWESSLDYYRLINQTVKARLGGLHSARCLMYSFDFAEIEALQRSGDWDGAAARLVDAAQRLVRGGAEGILICTNTMHLTYDAVQAAVDVPVLHIARPTGEAIRQAGLHTVGLLGTRFTMEKPYYRDYLTAQFGLNVLTPDDAGRRIVHDVIYAELVRGIIRDESRSDYQQIIRQLVADGAQGIILGCTEIAMLIRPADSPVPVFDTTMLHAHAAVDWALDDETHRHRS